MVGQKYLSILNTLSEQEQKRLETALTKEFSPDTKNHLALFRGLKMGKSEEEIWRDIGKKEPYKKSQHKKVLTRMVNSLQKPTENCLMLEHIHNRKNSEDPFLIERISLQLFKTKDNHHIVNQKYSKLFREIGNIESIQAGLKAEKNGLHSLAAHQLRYEMEDSMFHSEQKYKAQGVENRFPQLDEALNIYLLHHALFSSSQHKRYQDTGISDASINLGKILQNHVTKFSQHYENFPVLHFLLKLCKVQRININNAEEHKAEWESLYKTLQSFHIEKLLDDYSILNLFYLLQVEAARFVNGNLKKRKEYLQLLWRLYLWGTENKVVLQDGNLHLKDFLLILKLCHFLQQKESNEIVADELPQKLYEWKKMLPDSIRDDVWQMALMILSFQKGDYRKVINYSKQIKSLQQPYYKANARIYVCMARYDFWLKDIESENNDIHLEKELRNLKEFLDRDQKLEVHNRKGMKNFQRFLRQIYYLPNSIAKRKALKKELENTFPIYQRDWLKEKWSEIL